MIAGLETHDEGEIWLVGKDLTQIPCHKRNIGMVFHSLAIFPHLGVGDNAAYGMRLRGTSRKGTRFKTSRVRSIWSGCQGWRVVRLQPFREDNANAARHRRHRQQDSAYSLGVVGEGRRLQDRSGHLNTGGDSGAQNAAMRCKGRRE